MAGGERGGTGLLNSETVHALLNNSSATRY